MSGKGAPELSVRNCGDLRVAVIAAQWHEKVMDGLVNGALRALHELGIDEPTLLRVPGGVGLPGGGTVRPGGRAGPRGGGGGRGPRAAP
ncbi:6,7-dimethyl-8-ribityllumazine synthase, partial [Streptomyces mirabilis]|uniref:6,7-dimethyl-8-ribityllumazine synthase n=1 Tax=Streptomyces mirabilis TaxID=68239 RepID=UPI00367A2CE7